MTSISSPTLLRSLLRPLLVVAGLWVMLAAAPAEAIKPGGRAYIASTLANLRGEPDLRSEIVVKLAIGTRLEVIELDGSWAKVRTLRHEGWIARFLIDDDKPTVESLVARYRRAQGKEKLTYIERAAAIEPSNLEVIELLAEELRRVGDKEGALKARRGWIAAKRRSMKWDGPLYPVERGVALVSLPCGKESEANTGRATIPEEELRDRAIFLTGSGKVVSVTEEVPFFEDDLALPFCTDGACGKQLGYRLATKGRTGALVPSWLVAGHEITPFTKKEAEEGQPVTWEGQNGLVMVQLTDAGFWLLEKDFSGWTAHGFGAFPTSARGKPDTVRPVAWFADSEKDLRILWRMEGGRECCADEVSVWISRATPVQDGKTLLETGQVYSSGYAEKCVQPPFQQLEGEPREVSEEHVLSDAFKYE